MSVKGIDVSANNGHIDWHRVRASGVRFAFIKVSEGTYLNPQAGRDAAEAKAAGVIVGAYCFVSPREGRTGRQEAEFFIDHARKCGLLDKGCLRPAADIEATRLRVGKPSRIYHYRFIERIIATTGVKPFIYTGSWFWSGVLKARNGHGCPLWLAAYTSRWRRFIPFGFRGVSIHQYTDKGRVPGIVGNVDLDRYLGRDVAMLRRRHCLKRNV